MPRKSAIATISLGQPGMHSLHDKLVSAARAGFEGIELFYDDLASLASSTSTSTSSSSPPSPSSPRSSSSASSRSQSPPPPPSPSALLSAAHTISTWCTSLSLTVISLQPFRHYEGLISRTVHAAKLSELTVWFSLAHALHTDLILIPSSFLPKSECTGDMETIISDLRTAADMGARETPVVRFAFEALAWGTWIDVWERSWEVVQGVGRENFGLCVDTFNVCARVYADPEREDGVRKRGGKELRESMERMRERVDVGKVFLVQCCDAKKIEGGLGEDHEWSEEGMPARMAWSRNARVFPGEDDGYLPSGMVERALFDGLGYEDWVSLELFSTSTADADADTPRTHAERGFKAWEGLVEEFGLGKGR